MGREKSKNQKPLPPLNPEQVYQLLAQKQWSELVDILHAYYPVISSDSSLETAFNVFERELIRNFDDFKQDKKFERNLSNLHLIHSARFYQFAETTVNLLIVELAKLHDGKGDMEQAYYYASKLPQESFCASIIEKHSQTLPKVVKPRRVKESV